MVRRCRIRSSSAEALPFTRRTTRASSGSLLRMDACACLRANAETLYKLVSKHGKAQTQIVVHGTPNYQVAERRNRDRYDRYAYAMSTVSRRVTGVKRPSGATSAATRRTTARLRVTAMTASIATTDIVRAACSAATAAITATGTECSGLDTQSHRNDDGQIQEDLAVFR